MVRSRTYQSVESLRAFGSSFHDSTPFVFLCGFARKMPSFIPRFRVILAYAYVPYFSVYLTTFLRASTHVYFATIFALSSTSTRPSL